MNGEPPFPTEYPSQNQGPTSEEEILHVDIVAEQAVLGAILLNNEAFWSIDGWLQTKHFYEPLHQRIFELISSVVRADGVADPVSLRAKLSQDAAGSEIDVIGYLNGLPGMAVSMRPASYGRVVVEMFTRRSLAFAAMEINDSSNDAELSVEQMMGQAEAALAGVADENLGQVQIRTLGQAVDLAIEAATEAAQRDDGMVGVPMGLNKLDTVLGGARDGDLIILAGRPGMGKSALAVKMAVEGARQSGDDTGIGMISLEMKAEDLANRALSSEIHDTGMELPYSDISRGLYTGAQVAQIGDASRKIRDIPLHIEDTGRKSVSQIKSIARHIDRGFQKEGKKLGCLIIDHLSIIAPDAAYRGNKVAETEQISNELKSLAKQLQIPVIALCQLSRNVDSRDNKRPYMSDLRFSGAIEQDADVVMFVYRPAYYLDQDKKAGWDEGYADWKAQRDEAENKLDIIIAKNRNGSTGDAELWCQIECNVILDQKPYRGQQGPFEIGGDE